jgi:[lysine-biosynthesis-protein LysW]--L-2-aminoadipate ligase
VTAPRIAVLGSSANRTSVALVAEWRAAGLDCELVEPPGARESSCEIALGRLDVRPALDGVEPGLLDLFLLERAGTPVLNRAAALLATHDKLRTAAALERGGLPHPATRRLRPHEVGPLPRPPVVLKPRFGSWGRDVRLCRTDSEVAEAMHEFASRPWFRRQGILVQDVVETPGHDLRLVVAGGRVAGAVERHPRPGEWRTNVSTGASRYPASPDARACEIAVAAADAVGADLVGVDLIPLPDGDYVVIELNGAADFDQSYSPGRDIYADVADALGLAASAHHAGTYCYAEPRTRNPRAPRRGAVPRGVH